MKEVQRLGKEITLEELKKLQMDVLSAIDEFCREKGIRYSMSNGTMLGAVRHKGYIPWDDDIDIYLPRKDYETLMKQFPEVYKGFVKVSSLERSQTWDKPYGKAYDSRTLVVEKAYYSELYGVNIDMFPVDEVPDDEIEWEQFDIVRRKMYKKYERLMFVLPFSFQPKAMARWIYYAIHRLFASRRKMSQKIDILCKKWQGKGYSRVFECCQGQFQKKPFNKDVFDKLVEYPFEDRFFLGFDNYDEYLRNGFGDYMQLPPLEKRIAHHSFKAYWIK